MFPAELLVVQSCSERSSNLKGLGLITWVKILSESPDVFAGPISYSHI